jgi:hypothetical protein
MPSAISPLRSGRCLGLDEREVPSSDRNQEVHLEPLVVPEIIELASAARVQLLLGDLAGDEDVTQA